MTIHWETICLASILSYLDYLLVLILAAIEPYMDIDVARETLIYEDFNHLLNLTSLG
jgi:hypothetical protein